MKIYEIIVENTVEEGILPASFKVDHAKRILRAMGHTFERMGKGSHEIWRDTNNQTYPLAFHHKELEPASNHRLKQFIRNANFDISQVKEEIDEAMGLPADSSTLLSLLSEMINMLGAGGPKNDVGPLRSAVMQVFNNGSAEDADGFEKQLNFRLGSVRSMWMAKNWPQLKSCFLRLKKNPKYQNSIKALDELGDWPVFLIKDPKEKTPTLSKYFTAILSSSPRILMDMARLEPEQHVKDRSAHLAKLFPERMSEYSAFRNYWVDQYDRETAPAPTPKGPKDTLPGQQAAGAEDIISKVLGAIPPKLAGDIRPQIARMGSQNEKLMFIMKALQQAGIDPNKVLG